MRSDRPIGIFDSGIGGLTVARAVKKFLPEERLIYFGDTTHLPYGDKSTAAIQAYSVRITEWLLKRKCKVILIACNSASSAAYDLVTEYVRKKAKVFDVIQPTVDYIRERYVNERVGLIGTRQTVSRGVYTEKILSLDQNIDFTSLATPLLVPMIEEGFFNNQTSRDIIANYLGSPSLSDIKALILGCTHYPLIKNEINAFYGPRPEKVEIIDSAETVARALRSFLEYHQLLAKSRSEEDEFMVSDYTESFEKTTRIFFGRKVRLERISIWEE